ncbi:MAG: MarR family transcriptional regulator, partial [Phycisphaerae bacterium]|nr:MarR family transcriptional regulator [Phycisphaerae bacterium]
MNSAKRETSTPEMPEIYTVSQIAKKVGITRQSVNSRIKVLKDAGFEKEYGPFLKRGNGYLLT